MFGGVGLVGGVGFLGGVGLGVGAGAGVGDGVKSSSTFCEPITTFCRITVPNPRLMQ